MTSRVRSPTHRVKTQLSLCETVTKPAVAIFDAPPRHFKSFYNITDPKFPAVLVAKNLDLVVLMFVLRLISKGGKLEQLGLRVIFTD